MTRKSQRELERAVDDLSGDADAVDEWANRYFERTAKQGFDADCSTSPWTLRNPAVVAAPEEEAIIPFLETVDGTFFAPQSAVPDWIDREDLPVEA